MSTPSENWFGLDVAGGKIMISHADLMKWACENDMPFQVGWSPYVTIRGKRLVRGPQKIATARSVGWDDIADQLAECGISDAA